MQAALRDGSVTSRQLVELHLERIAKLNPTLHAVIETNPDALAIADRLDRELRESGPRGPLHGIPILLKDSIETADRMQTTAGSSILVGVPVLQDAFLVQRLRAAGAVLLGKANLTQWVGAGDRAGWSERGGQTVNPYDVTRSPVGSSSGSASAVAASLAPVALGTETIGSIIGPAALAGLVGMKPTVGLISRSGVVPFAPSQDGPGVLARSVEDAALVVEVIAGLDPSDSATLSPQRPRIEALGTPILKSLRGVRIGVVREASMTPETKRLFEGALGELKRLGAVLVEAPEIRSPGDEDWRRHNQVLLSEIKASVSDYLHTRRPGARVQSVDELVELNRVRAKELGVAEGFLGGYLARSLETRGLFDPLYFQARRELWEMSRDKGIDAAIDSHRLSALVGYGIGPAWKVEDDWPSPSNGIFYSAAAGYPSITLPMGDVAGMPVGLMFFGKAWSDRQLLDIARAYESGTHHREPPNLDKLTTTPR